MFPESLPDAGPRVNHAAAATAFQFNVPPPTFVTVRVCIVGLPSPCRAVKEKLVVLTPIAGFGNGGDGIEIGGGAVSGVSFGISDASRRIGAVGGLVCIGELLCGIATVSRSVAANAD
jgi:hypothetical protein